MTSREFCYWLQGYFEVAKLGLPDGHDCIHMNSGQIKCIEDHLALVFDKKTPDRSEFRIQDHLIPNSTFITGFESGHPLHLRDCDISKIQTP